MATSQNGQGHEKGKHMESVDDAGPWIGEGVRFDRIRRITGYLVGTLDRFNNAKRQEVQDRVKHQLSQQRACPCSKQ